MRYEALVAALVALALITPAAVQSFDLVPQPPLGAIIREVFAQSFKN